MLLHPTGQKRFRSVPARVFQTRPAVRLACQLNIGELAPLLILGGRPNGPAAGVQRALWRRASRLGTAHRANSGTAPARARPKGVLVPRGGGGVQVDDQAGDLAELLDHLSAIGAVRRRWVLTGHSSGGRPLGLLAFKRPDLAQAAALLMDGRAAAAALAEQYYLQYARAAAAAECTLAVLRTPLYMALCGSNARSRERLRRMPAQAFMAAMRASADLFLTTRDAPALGLPETELRQLGETTPLFVCNYFGPGEHDGMHTAATSRAVAAAAGQGRCELVLSADPKMWLEALVQFVRRNAGARLGPAGVYEQCVLRRGTAAYALEVCGCE